MPMPKIGIGSDFLAEPMPMPMPNPMPIQEPMPMPMPIENRLEIG
jgi:hypothetical protein